MVHGPPLGKAEQGHHVFGSLKWFYKMSGECAKD